MHRLAALAVLVALTGCKKPPEPAAPKLGWVQTDTMKAACYYPPDFATLGPGDRKIARSTAIKEMMTQWTGGRGDGISFDSDMITDVETALLGEPEAVEAIAAKNAAQCETYMTTGGSTSGWSSWLTGLPAKITEGECWNPLVDTWFNYLDLARGWQNRAPVCQGDKVAVKGTEIDYYRIEDGGPWINAAGDTSKPTSGNPEMPCHQEGCFAGMLVVRFTGESGATVTWPAGLGVVITAPEHGYIEVAVNDDNLSDNKFKVESGLEHHTGIEYKPAK